MDENSSNEVSPPVKRSGGFAKFVKIVAGIFIITALIAAAWVKHNIYASEFKPTTLNEKEQAALDSKLSRLDESARFDRTARRHAGSKKGAPLEPEAYSEVGAKREIVLTEKEINSIIARDPEMARRVAIDLSKDLVSIKLVLPIDEDFPIIGGKTLRLKLGVELKYAKDRPVVALKGVSMGGILLPNAWMGNIKHRNLVDEFGEDGGFWKLFSEGVRDISVGRGRMTIKLKA